MKRNLIVKMDWKEEKFLVPSLYREAIKVVYDNFIQHNPNFDIKNLPDLIIFDLIRLCYKRDETKKLLHEKLDLDILTKLLKYEKYRPKLMKFYQALINCNYPIGMEFVKTFTTLSISVIGTNDDNLMIKHIRHGLRFGSFLSEAAWYSESEQVLRLTKNLSSMLPKSVLSYKLQLECCHRLFHTLTMFFKFDDASHIYKEITDLMVALERCGESLNYTILYTEFSKYSFLKSNYEQSYKWIKKAIYCLDSKTAIPTQIQVLRQASKVCVVKRDFVKAKFLMHQALARAELFYGSGYYKLASLLQDFGFYLLNSDNIEQSASVYNEAYKLRCKMFGSEEKNLHVAIAEEDLAYALYVLEYSSGYFEDAMKHAERAIDTMKILLPPGNLMLSSANRVKALILEEMALDNFMNNADDDIHNMLEEAEKLHQDALSLTKRTFGEENTLTAKHYGNLGRLYQSMKKYEDAEEMHLKAIKIKEEILGPDDYEVGLSVGHLASLYNYHMQEYRKAEQLYYRSININLKLFSESYSGLEYDYRGLIHVYEKLKDHVQIDKFTSKLLEWTKLRSICTPDKVGPDFYRELNPAPVESIIDLFENASTSTA